MENPNFEGVLQGQNINTAASRVKVLTELGISALDATARVARQTAVGTGVSACEGAARHGAGSRRVQREIGIANIVVALDDVDFAVWVAVVVYRPARVRLVNSINGENKNILGWPNTTRSGGHVLKVCDKDTAAKGILALHTYRVAARIGRTQCSSVVNTEVDLVVTGVEKARAGRSALVDIFHKSAGRVRVLFDTWHVRMNSTHSTRTTWKGDIKSN